METKIIKSFIKELIENNSYYEKIRNEYINSKDKEFYINEIYGIFIRFACYFSIYTIMNTIEDRMNYGNETFKDVVEDDMFEIE